MIRIQSGRLNILLIMLMGALIIFTAAYRVQAQAPKPEEQFPFSGKISQDGVNLRAGQSTSFEQVGELRQGQDVVVVDKAYEWFKVKLPVDASSYVSTEYVIMMRDNVGMVTANRLNVRARPGTNYSVMGQLNKGDLVKIRKQEDDWFLIEPVEDTYGWVHEKFVVFASNQVPQPRIVTLPEGESVVAVPAVEPIKETTIKPKVVTGEPEMIAEGLIGDLGKDAVSKNIRHKIVTDDSRIYYLEGRRRIIDGFLHHQVTVEGDPVTTVDSPYPVIFMKKIELVL